MIWIELADLQGQLLGRRPADAVPCTIGSARDNTLVVDGDGILPYHARIDLNADGTLSVTALGAHPGLHRPGAPERHPTLLLTPTASVAIGTATLRLLDAQAVAHAAADDPREPALVGWRAWAARREVQWAMAALVLVAGAAFSWFTIPTKDRLLTAVIVGLMLLLAEVLWVSGWALAGRLRHGAPRFGQHFVVAVVMTLVSLMASELSSWQQFLTPGTRWAAGLMLLLTTVVAGVGLFAQLRVFGPQNREKHMRIAAGVTAVMLLLVVAAARLGQGWSSTVDFSAVLKPWPVSMTPASGVDTYGESLTKLEAELEADKGD